MLSKFDDYPIHQTAEPVFHTASSDRFQYDRFWYNAHALDGSFYFGVGLCRYPNLGILDGSLSLAIDGRQYAFHGSRRAPQEPTELSVGPMELQILEPMGRHRLVIGENETGISCDLTFTPRTACIEEGRQTLRNERHIVMDATRLDQFGAWSGWIRYDGKELKVDGATTFGLKDRSWGIRPVGDAYTGGAPMADFQAVHFNWLPIFWEDHCSLAGWFEDGEGHQWHTDQGFLPLYAGVEDVPGTNDSGTRLWQGKVQHKLDFIPGTRRARSGVITMHHKSGESMEISVEPVLVHRMKGLGYQHPEWGHGKWHGELVIGGESWTDAELDPLALENIHVQQIVVARCGDKVGHGVLEQMHIGPSPTHGFDDWFDGAK
ncbi:hypothetical protein BST95_16175 [Halioglobus japonicus]|uniref:AttH domain-containing protein n=1 Tax=Halioglobus japonicus TaxID=930805 RepID=A0AAP8SPB3_9GAMM|nr:hypothetical protein [Halioglobus japonicus]AQA19542.1 hypothetical protein BST95_16175 [Halioglobus japonicus]PLW87391.1 hypothetical protein C0029_02025 [Halioglobus japonicus]GHD08733.1 hypothetical protein GCM10007052_05920 [Halioglobus japonicus]